MNLLRGIKKDSPHWIVVGESGGPVTYHQTQEEAHSAARERGAGGTIETNVYVAQILLTNDPAQWARPIEEKRPAKKTARRARRASP